jgi:hypothetical protein
VIVILLSANIAALLEFTVGILISKLISQEITAIAMPILESLIKRTFQRTFLIELVLMGLR